MYPSIELDPKGSSLLACPADRTGRSTDLGCPLGPPPTSTPPCPIPGVYTPSRTVLIRSKREGESSEVRFSLVWARIVPRCAGIDVVLTRGKRAGSRSGGRSRSLGLHSFTCTPIAWLAAQPFEELKRCACVLVLVTATTDRNGRHARLAPALCSRYNTPHQGPSHHSHEGSKLVYMSMSETNKRQPRKKSAAHEREQRSGAERRWRGAYRSTSPLRVANSRGTSTRERQSKLGIGDGQVRSMLTGAAAQAGTCEIDPTRPVSLKSGTENGSLRGRVVEGD